MKPSEQQISPFCPKRRAILAALAGGAVLPVALAACSSDSDDAVAGSSGVSDGTAPAGSGSTVPAASVPVGGALVVDGTEPVVVAQPTAGKFVAHSGICTHQGGHVRVTDGLTLMCPLHGSEFNAGTGAVERGPAAAPLPTVPVTLQGDTLRLG